MQSPSPEPWFASFRAEGLPLRQAALHAPAYLAKYWYKRADPDGLERHFHEARAAVEATVGRAPPGAVSVGFVGDLMWVRDGWEDILGASLRARLGGLQLLVGNLETPVAPSLPVPGGWPDALRYNAPPSYLRAWAGAGVPWPQLLLGLANNHSWDCGAQGAVETMAELERQGILHCGLRSVNARASVAVWEQRGFRIGVLAVTWGLNAPGADIGSSMQVEVEPDLLANEGVPSLTSVRRCVHALQEKHVDLVFALVHWGHEFECLPTARQRAIAVELHVLGVDVVCGSHSHVVQPAEVIEGKDRETLVLYSVGNATTAMFTDACRASVLVELRCWRDLSGRGRWAWAGADPLFNLFPGDLGTRRSLERIDTLLGDDLPRDLLRRLRSERARLRTQLPAAGSRLP